MKNKKNKKNILSKKKTPLFGTGRQATMLKKLKGKMKRRNTEPTMNVVASGPHMSLAVAPTHENDEIDSNNTDF